MIEPPKKGKLILDVDSSERDEIQILLSREPEKMRVEKFTQLNIDDGALQYMHSVEMDEGDEIEMDYFTFNLTAGNDTTGPEKLEIRIVQNQVRL